jgi:hypothetical protein
MNFFTYGFTKRAKELIVGGKADGKPSSDFPADQIAKGKKVEMEHTNNPAIAEEISRDHLQENRRYYSILSKVGL